MKWNKCKVMLNGKTQHVDGLLVEESDRRKGSLLRQMLKERGMNWNHILNDKRFNIDFLHFIPNAHELDCTK